MEIQLSPPRPPASVPSVLMGGQTEAKVAVLTFDDGPHYLFTPYALDILRKEKVKAVFFVTGRMAERHPDLVKRILAEGHELGNHSFSHASMAHLTPFKMEVEYRAAQDVVEGLTGHKMRWARPPGGSMNPHVTQAAMANGLTTALWTVAPKDYQRPATDLLLARVEKQLGPGAILLLHDGPPSTLRDLPALIQMLRGKGYQLVNLTELEQLSRPQLASAGKKKGSSLP